MLHSHALPERFLRLSITQRWRFSWQIKIGTRATSMMTTNTMMTSSNNANSLQQMQLQLLQFLPILQRSPILVAHLHPEVGTMGLERTSSEEQGIPVGLRLRQAEM